VLQALQDLAGSPRAADVVLICIVLEGAVLMAWNRRTGAGLPPLAVIVSLLPGACLVLALRFALSAGPPSPGVTTAIMACLLAALLAHLLDLVRQLRLAHRARVGKTVNRGADG